MEYQVKSLPLIEHDILAFWRDNNIFAKTVELHKNDKSFVFYDGPPFATGLPHHGHILQMAIKDAVLRYKTMQGFNVPRKIGWDTHGLPVEYLLEKELSLAGKKDIEAYGIDNFVTKAREIVLRYTAEWTKTMERMGRWVNTSNPYATMDNEYIESVWWAFAELYSKGLVYEDYRVSPYCPRCGTVLSNFEVNLGYQDDISDRSVYTAIRITEGNFKDQYLVFWTTTPWTIPAVMAMSVNKAADYVSIKQNNKIYIVAANLSGQVFPDEPHSSPFSGADLIGLHYEPPYSINNDSNAHRIVHGDHVTTEDGTGIASIAPAYGEVDFEVGKREHLPLTQTIEKDGTVKIGLNLPGEGKFIKRAEQDVIDDLTNRGLLIKEERIKHTYPFCWRCSTPLLYFPTTSWFVKVTEIKSDLLDQNNQINWQPEHLKSGRFGRWLEGARDWAISRDRYWGAPLPVWKCTNPDHRDTKPLVIESLAQLKQLTSSDINDLHRPYLDNLTINCNCGAAMKRVEFVFDCWFESGSMPFAQHHYPFENQNIFNPSNSQGYPADFIAEALDQTRGWFYTLHVLGTALFKKRAFNSVAVSGLVLASDGKKLSKSLRNYTEPAETIESEGVDALRLFLFTTTTLGEDYRFSDKAVGEAKRRWITPLLNVVQYYKLSIDDRDEQIFATPHQLLLDSWIKARVAQARTSVTEAMDGKGERSPYDLVRACRTFGPLVEDLSTWYIRLSRGRQDAAFTETLQQVLIKISTTFAPFLPFIMEHIYQSVGELNKGFPESVHLCQLKSLDNWSNPNAIDEMNLVRDIVTLGRDLRAMAGFPLRQPLSQVELRLSDTNKTLSSESLAIITQELNVESTNLVTTISPSYKQSSSTFGTVGLDITLTHELKFQGQVNHFRRTIQDLRKQANLRPGDKATIYVEDMPEALREAIELALSNTIFVSVKPDQTAIVTTQFQNDELALTINLYSPTNL